MDLFPCHFDPVAQCRISRKHLQYFLVRFVNIFRFTRQGHPAERPLPFTKKRANIGGDKSWIIKGIFHTGFYCLGTNIISIIKRDRALRFQFENTLHMFSHSPDRFFNIGFRVCFSKCIGLIQGIVIWDIAYQFIMGRRLVRHQVGYYPPMNEFRYQIGRIS